MSDEDSRRMEHDLPLARRLEQVLRAGKLLPTMRRMRWSGNERFVSACQKASSLDELPREHKETLLRLEDELAAHLKVDSVWVIAGNVVTEPRPVPGVPEARRGTNVFNAGAKIYLASLRHYWALVDGGN